MQKTNRIVALDWLRGFCAISIMLYHFFFLNTNDILFGKLGIYAVSTFFVISGLSMAIVYNGYIKGYKESVIFFSKRIFRIIPIYIIACILTILLDWLSKHNFRYSFTDIILNITTLFGLLNLSSGYIPAGGWSIGNEMCFYLLTPFILYLYDKRKVYGNLFLIAVCIIGLYFCFFLMKPDETINQWEIYINPLNNLFLFVAGIAIFYNFNKLKINQFLNITILFISFTIFLLYPFSSYTQTGIMTECNGGGVYQQVTGLYTKIGIMTGWNRIIFVIIVITWVFSFFKMKITKISKVGKLFEMFGMATYGVYILHMIVRGILMGFNKILKLNFSNLIICILAVFATIVVAIISYYYFETKISNWGKQLVKKIFNESKN